MSTAQLSPVQSAKVRGRLSARHSVFLRTPKAKDPDRNCSKALEQTSSKLALWLYCPNLAELKPEIEELKGTMQTAEAFAARCRREAGTLAARPLGGLRLSPRRQRGINEKRAPLSTSRRPLRRRGRGSSWEPRRMLSASAPAHLRRPHHPRSRLP